MCPFWAPEYQQIKRMIKANGSAIEVPRHLGGWLPEIARETLFSLLLWFLFSLSCSLFFLFTVRLIIEASMDTCQTYRDSRGHCEWQLSLSLGLMLSLRTCNCDGGLTHSQIRIGTGEGTLGDELQTLLRIIHPSERLFSPNWNSFPLAAPDSAETLARATASTFLFQKCSWVCWSFSGGSQSDWGSFCQQQAATLLSGSAWGIDPSVDGYHQQFAFICFFCECCLNERFW